LPGANTLAYNKNLEITAVKSFIGLAPAKPRLPDWASTKNWMNSFQSKIEKKFKFFKTFYGSN
jgi:hypothetical protein